MIDEKVRINTLVDEPRLEVIKSLIHKTKYVPGDIAEVGVYKGGTALFIRQLTNKQLYLFDTFTGMPPTTTNDIHKQGDFCDTSVEHVDSLLKCYDNYCIYKGTFPQENYEYITQHRFSLVHLDVDIYTSIKQCLEFFAPRMNLGGVIILDDYNEPDCPGAKLAADEYFSNKPQQIQPTIQSQAIIQF